MENVNIAGLKFQEFGKEDYKIPPAPFSKGEEHKRIFPLLPKGAGGI